MKVVVNFSGGGVRVVRNSDYVFYFTTVFSLTISCLDTCPMLFNYDFLPALCKGLSNTFDIIK